jgi:hypothetical protein
MFTLAGKFPFEADSEMCWLSALVGYNDDFSWDLHLQSLSAITRLPGGAERVSFGIHVHPPLGIKNWCDLCENSLQISADASLCGFMFHCGAYQEWEDLVALRLRFGRTRRSEIEVFAEGRGCAEGASDIFHDQEVEFRIEEWVRFRGVAVNVPLNATDPIGYSESRVRALLPGYAFSAPVLRRSSDDAGTVRAVEILFSPDESVS